MDKPVGNELALEDLKRRAGEPSKAVPRDAPGPVCHAYELGYRHGYEDAFTTAWRDAQEAIEAMLKASREQNT